MTIENTASSYGLHHSILPNNEGLYGEFGGKIGHPELAKAMDEIEKGFREIIKDEGFVTEMKRLRETYIGRPSPIFHARRLTEYCGGAQIYFKREDLNHTGAHKINHCLGEVLLAKKLGKSKVIAETGAGQHGVALATAAALMGVECEIHMGVVDIEKEYPNVSRMKILGAKIVPVSRGAGTLKEAVDSAFETYMNELDSSMFAIGSALGPAPYPEIVSYFQSVVGREARAQFLETTGQLPNKVVACVGGGSNAIGIFSGFLDDASVEKIGVEPAGEGLDTPNHAATMTLGIKGEIHGFKCYVLLDKDGEPAPVHSIASGLDYPGVGPQHSLLRDMQLATYESVTDAECLEAFMALSRLEGIIPALESAHAIAHAMKIAKDMSPEETILVNLSGRGDKDIDFVLDKVDL